MREVVKKFNVYKYDELSDKAKENALERLYDINISHNWWDYLYETFKEQLNEVGLTCDTFYFSLDRDYHIDAEKLRFTDSKLFIKKSVDEKIKNSIIEVLDLYIENTGFKRTSSIIESGSCYFMERHPRLTKVANYIEIKATKELQTILEYFLKRLQEEHEYLQSKEAILESIECNDFEFFEDGSLYG
jgi:hypothetical protein